VEDPAQVLTNVLDSIKDAKSVAEAYRKIFKVSSFDREAKKQICDAINLLIVKWRTVQSTLERKGRKTIKVGQRLQPLGSRLEKTAEDGASTLPQDGRNGTGLDHSTPPEHA